MEYQLVSGDWIPGEQAESLPNIDIKWIANEGVRVSKIIAATDEIHAGQVEQKSVLVQELLDDAYKVRPFPNTVGTESIVSPPIIVVQSVERTDDSFLMERARQPQRNLRPLSYYADRQGYDPDFLGINIPLPQLMPQALRFGNQAEVIGTPDNVLRYTHFSVLFNASRWLAFFTAVNIDGMRWTSLTRGDDDEWYYDPRLSPDLQIGNELYRESGRNWFDRGHLVRRLDPVWGPMPTATLANEDTFHWTNCAPQYWRFNQSQEVSFQ